VEALKELQVLAPYPGETATFTAQKVAAQRKWLSYYGGLAWGRRDFKWDVEAWNLSPDYTEKELDAVDAGTGYSISHLLPMLMDIDFDKTTTFRCPVFVFVGAHISRSVVPRCKSSPERALPLRRCLTHGDAGTTRQIPAAPCQ
jgi:hypothetical protein